jgi:hypothetical protein
LIHKEEIMLSKSIFAVALGLSLSGAGFAQTQNPPAVNGPGNNAVNSSGKNNSAAPVKGANSFTESQAKSRIQKAGFSSVSGLKKDKNGVWRGKAAKGSKTVNVSVDFEGNVIGK